MTPIRSKINRFFYRNQNKGIRNLMLYISIGNVIIYLLTLMNTANPLFYHLLRFDYDKLMAGQVWRLVTYPLVYLTEMNQPFLGIISLFFYYWCGTVLDQYWGALRFNLYYLCGVVLTDLAAILLGLVTAAEFGRYGISVSSLVSVDYVNMSLLLAVATVLPEQLVRIWFVIPVKMKWLAWLDVGLTLYNMVNTSLTLVRYGVRLPAAKDNRPLRFEEIKQKLNQVIYVSATPGEYELELSKKEAEDKNVSFHVPVEQVIRPTGLLDPLLEVRPSKTQVTDVIGEIQKRVAAGERTLITVLTKRMAEELTDYLIGEDIKVTYLHSDIDTMERTEVINSLRKGEVDVLVGINLLREGLDLPEVTLVAIFDADQEGFLRSTRSLIQTIGRAARNIKGSVILYADAMTDALKAAIDETERRRAIQEDYNAKNGIVPRTVWKEIDAPLRDMVEADYIDPAKDAIENMLRDRRKASGEKGKNSKRKFLARRARSKKILDKIKGETEGEIC